MIEFEEIKQKRHSFPPIKTTLMVNPVRKKRISFVIWIFFVMTSFEAVKPIETAINLCNSTGRNKYENLWEGLNAFWGT
jgi:hypothetical protein